MADDSNDFAAGFNQPTKPEPDADKPESGAPAAKAAPESDTQAPQQPAAAPAPAQGEGAAGDPAATGDDIAAKLKRLEFLEHREDSSHGRLQHYTRANAKLQQDLAEANKRLAALEAAAKAAAEKSAASEPDPELDDVLSKAPDLKAAVEARIKRATGQVQQKLDAALAKLNEVDERAARAVQEVEPLRRSSEAAQMAEATRQLDAEFTGWREEIKTDRFRQWLDMQDQRVQQLYEEATTAAGAGAVLKLYRADTGALAKQAPAPAPDPKQAQADARVRQATGIRSKSAPIKADDSNDFSAGFRMAVTN